MLAGGVCAPPVVDNHLLLDGGVIVEPGQELPGLPVVDGARVSVRPDQVWLVVVD